MCLQIPFERARHLPDAFALLRFRNWNTTLRLKGTSPSRISEKSEKERRSPQRSPSTSPLPDQQSSCCNDADSHAHRTPPAVRHRCRAHNAYHCACDSSSSKQGALGSSSSPKMNGRL